MKWFSRLIGKEEFKIQTFTYYVPAPPPRKTGYREKEFDSLFYQFMNRGYEVVDFKTVAHTGANQCGMWIILLVRALNAQADKLDLDFEANGLEEHPLEQALDVPPLFEREIELPSLDDEKK
jgi:hypothetical protein